MSGVFSDSEFGFQFHFGLRFISGTIIILELVARKTLICRSIFFETSFSNCDQTGIHNVASYAGNMVKESYKAPVTCVPNKDAAETGLTAQWISSDRLIVFPSSSNAEKNAEHVRSSTQSEIFILNLDLLLFDPLLRKLINESCGLLVASANIKKYESKDGYQTNQLLKLSRKCRSVLRESIENIQDEESRLLGFRTQNFDNCVALLYNLEFLWHLTEVLYIDSISEDIALPYVTSWLRFHFPEPERGARKILQSVRDDEASSALGIQALNHGAEHAFPDYWDTVNGLVLQGNIDLTRALLLLHSQSNSDTFTEVDRILRTMPVYNIYGELSLPEFKMQWKLWQTNVQKKFQTCALDEYPELEFIIKVLSGDVSSCMDELKVYCTSWYQAMVAALLYTEPAIKFYEFSHHAHRYIQHYGGTAALNYCDATVLALFERDLRSAIKKFQLAADGGWLAAHLTHLLALCGKIEEVEDKLEDDDKDARLPLNTKLMLEYGTLLMSHKSLWQVGLCYLDQCSGEGVARQQVLLANINPSSDMKAMKLIGAALRRGLVDVASSICKVQGVEALRLRRLGKALEWAFRSQDSAFASHLADEFLQHYVLKGVFQSADLLDNLGHCMLMCDRLTFLGKYLEFRRLYTANELKEAAKCLNDLITSRIAPKYFWLTLLNDALPLLESPEEEPPLFDQEQTMNLTHCLIELCSLSEGNMSSLLSPAQNGAFERTINLIRFALSKNFAKAICYQATAETV